MEAKVGRRLKLNGDQSCSDRHRRNGLEVVATAIAEGESKVVGVYSKIIIGVLKFVNFWLGLPTSK